MSASIGPDENSQAPQDLEASEQQGFTSSDQGAPDYDPEYVAEREFVLMPLFRRIGQLLGLRRHDEPQHIYQSEPGSPVQASIAEPQPDTPAPMYAPIEQDAAPIAMEAVACVRIDP